MAMTLRGSSCPRPPRKARDTKARSPRARSARRAGLPAPLMPPERRKNERRRVGLNEVCLSHPARLFSFPFFSTTASLFLSIFRGKLRGNRQIFGSEPSLRLVGPKISQILGQIGKMPGLSRRTRVYLEITLRPPGYFVDFLNLWVIAQAHSSESAIGCYVVQKNRISDWPQPPGSVP